MSGADDDGTSDAGSDVPARGILDRFRDGDAGLIAVTMLLIYVLFAILTALGPSEGPIVGSILSNLQAITLWTALYAMLVLALNLHWGYTGLFNIGVAGFMAIGIYAYAFMTVPKDPSRPGAPPGLGVPQGFADAATGLLPFLDPGLASFLGLVAGIAVAIVVAMLAAGLVGAITALPALRLRADYLAIVTVALSEIIRLSLLSREMETFTLGTNLNFELGGIEFLPDVPVGTGAGRGIDIPINPTIPVKRVFYTNPGNPAAGDTTAVGDLVFGVLTAPPFGLRETTVSNLAYTLVLVGFVAAFYWLLVRIGNSPFGRVLKAIREDEIVANSLGKDTRVFKVKVFVVGCALMGLGGILWETRTGFTDPTSTTMMPLQTFYIFIALIIGGAGSNTGSVIGGALFAAVLFQGPLYFSRIVNKWIAIDTPPQTSHGALAEFASLDPTPLLAYVVSNVSWLRFIIVGVVLIYVIQNRPTGLLGHRKEEAASVSLSRRDRPSGGAVAADGGEDRE
ncbi:branched-chain amino acid ABC transporter permease [Halobacteriales archaeon QS_8_69_26]|nr:MAG: branched-chain amino acid ABC transporter permease [Halobacteriales archaeon QS_8_69_26]